MLNLETKFCESPAAMMPAMIYLIHFLRWFEHCFSHEKQKKPWCVTDEPGHLTMFCTFDPANCRS